MSLWIESCGWVKTFYFILCFCFSTVNVLTPNTSLTPSPPNRIQCYIFCLWHTSFTLVCFQKLNRCQWHAFAVYFIENKLTKDCYLRGNVYHYLYYLFVSRSLHSTKIVCEKVRHATIALLGEFRLTCERRRTGRGETRWRSPGTFCWDQMYPPSVFTLLVSWSLLRKLISQINR